VPSAIDCDRYRHGRHQGARKEGNDPRGTGAAKDKFREEVLGDRRNRFFSAYMVKAKERMRIEVNREALQRRQLGA